MSTKRTRLILCFCGLSSITAQDLQPGSAWVFLEDGALMRVCPLDSPCEPFRVQLQKPGFEAQRSPGRYLDYDGATHRLYVLSPGEDSVPSQITSIDFLTGRIMKQCAVDDFGIRERSLSFGKQSGMLYLFGNMDRRTGESASVIVSRVAASTCQIADQWNLTRPVVADWFIYQGGVDRDEQLLFISYHGSPATQDQVFLGGGTTGVDRFSLRDGKPALVGCDLPKAGCLGGHGSFSIQANSVFIATGSQAIRSIGLGADGLRREFNTGLTRNHLMEFEIDPIQQRLYAIGPCNDGSGGFSAVNVPSGETMTVVPRTPCGQRVVLFNQNTIITFGGSTTHIGMDIRFVKTSSGATRSIQPVPTSVLDIIVARPSP
jgi:hypothetical protein